MEDQETVYGLKTIGSKGHDWKDTHSEASGPCEGRPEFLPASHPVTSEVKADLRGHRLVFLKDYKKEFCRYLSRDSCKIL